MAELKKNTISPDAPNIQSAEVTQMQDIPYILQKISSTLGLLHPNAAKSCLMGILLAKTFQMISFKRCCFQELNNTRPKFLNWYQINLMPSGKGKDKISDDLDDYFLTDIHVHCRSLVVEYQNDVKRRIEQQAEQKYTEEKQAGQRTNYIKKEMEKVRNIVMELNAATPEGLYADAETLKDLEFGSIFVKYPEFGLLLQNSRQEDLLTLNALFEAYDSKIHSKSTKFDKRKETIENVPVNLLAHADQTMFKRDVQSIFTGLFQTGLGRRAVLTFQSNNTAYIEPDPIKALNITKAAYEEAAEIGKKLLTLFEQIPLGAVYKLAEDAYTDKFYPYKKQIVQQSNENADNEMLRREIESRELKVLKLSGLFACLNHPQELVINQADIQQAINTVELLSKDLPKFLSYRPKTSDSYEKLYNLFYSNIGAAYTKTQLVNRYREFGFKREYFRDRFDEIIEIAAEIATDKGYCLVSTQINNNSGVEVKLIKPDNILPEDVQTLGNIIAVDAANAVNPVNAAT